MSALGQKRTVAAHNVDVRFAPKSGHVQCTRRCPLSANSGQMHRSKQRHYDHWGRVRSLGACRRFLIFIPSDGDCDDRHADWIFERRKLRLRGGYVWP